MDKKTKFYLKNIIKESISTDVDEMARRPEGKRDPKGKIRKYQPVFSKDNPTPPGGDGAPDGWVINIGQVEGQERLVIMYYDCGDLDSLIDRYRSLFEELESEYNLVPELVPCKAEGRTEIDIRRTIDQPRSTAVGTPYRASGEKYSISENINRKLYPIIREKLGNADINLELQKRSFPPVKVEDAYLNKHAEKPTNEKVLFQCHSYNSYDSLGSFFESVISVLDGNAPSGMHTHYLARGFNTIYKNWERTRKQRLEYKGKTKKYKLDVVGLDQSNLDASILMSFGLSGKKEGDTFVWKAVIETSISKKKDVDKYVKDGSMDMFNKKASVKVDIDPNKTFDDNYTVMDDKTIVGGLNRCLDLLVDEIKSIDPESVLDYATMDVYMLSNSTEVNENKKINYFVNSIINEIKNKNR
jgi:hypothetical protein